MTRKFLIILLLSLPFTLFAQTQKGYVRTAGKPNESGKPLSGVSIKPSGNYNAALSDSSGHFALTFSDLRNGDPFALQDVYKSGYELLDKEFLGYTHPFSDTVTLEIVMISRSELLQTQIDIEERARANAQKKYHARLDSLNKQLEGQRITGEMYRKELEKLRQQQAAFDKLVVLMAERYARTDYDKLDSLNKLINAYIANGELLKADSLINSKGNIHQRVQAHLQLKENLQKANDQLLQAEQQLDLGKKQSSQQRSHLTQDLYNNAFIALRKANRDSAIYYMTLRAELDSANYVCQKETAIFFSDSIGDYHQTIHYLQKAERLAKKQLGEENEEIADIYNDLAQNYFLLNLHSKSLFYYQKVLDIYTKIYGEKHPTTIGIAQKIEELRTKIQTSK